MPWKYRSIEFGTRGLFRAPRLGGDELGVELAGQARDDFVLHVEEIGQGFVEPLGPEVTARFGVDELDIPRACGFRRAEHSPENIARMFRSRPIVFTSSGLPLKRERRVAGDHDVASKPR